MKYCPKCGNKYSTDLDFCTVDGSRLAVSDAEAQTLRMETQAEQQFTRILETYTLDIGDYADFVTPRFSIHITFKDLVESEFPISSTSLGLSKQIAAHLEFDGLGF